MGELILPNTGPIYLDASGFIYSLERIEPYCTLLEPMWRHAQAGQFVIASSHLVVLETLVKPLREGDMSLEQSFRDLRQFAPRRLGPLDGDMSLEQSFRDLLYAREVQLIPATLSIWERAARLRATTGLKTPDALHVATAQAAASALFITSDRDFRRVADLPVVVLDDLAKK